MGKEKFFFIFAMSSGATNSGLSEDSSSVNGTDQGTVWETTNGCASVPPGHSPLLVIPQLFSGPVTPID